MQRYIFVPLEQLVFITTHADKALSPRNDKNSREYKLLDKDLTTRLQKLQFSMEDKLELKIKFRFMADVMRIGYAASIIEELIYKIYNLEKGQIVKISAESEKVAFAKYQHLVITLSGFD